MNANILSTLPSWFVATTEIVAGIVGILVTGIKTWTSMKTQGIHIKNVQSNLLQAMIKTLSAPQNDNQANDLLIEYQFKTLFGFQLQADEIREIVYMNYPLLMISLRKRSSGIIRYNDKKFSVRNKFLFKLLIYFFNTIYILSFVFILGSYILFLLNLGGASVALSALYAIAFFLSWFGVGKDFYSAKEFLSRYTEWSNRQSINT
ncbi:MAG: hypothetical protein AB7T01_02230 [Acidithiobacillus sp.]